VICGDFNGEPFEPLYDIIGGGGGGKEEEKKRPKLESAYKLGKEQH
jgi:hypothetical protein